MMAKERRKKATENRRRQTKEKQRQGAAMERERAKVTAAGGGKWCPFWQKGVTSPNPAVMGGECHSLFILNLKVVCLKVEYD